MAEHCECAVFPELKILASLKNKLISLIIAFANVYTK